MTRSGSTYYYMADGLGSIRNVLESDEDVANIYDYYAFGNTLGTPTTAVTSPYEYTAREFEDGGVNTTLYYRNRYYMSALGVFTSRDARWADVHRGWGYVGSNPLIWVDPYGTVIGVVVKGGTEEQRAQTLAATQDLLSQLNAYGNAQGFGLNKGRKAERNAWLRIRKMANDRKNLFLIAIDLDGKCSGKGASSDDESKPLSIEDLSKDGNAKRFFGDYGNLVENAIAGLVTPWDGTVLEEDFRNLLTNNSNYFASVNGAYANNEIGQNYGPEGYFMNEAIHEMQHEWQAASRNNNADWSGGLPQIGENGASEAEKRLAIPFLEWNKAQNP